MHRVEVFGTGCAKCKQLFSETQAAAQEAGVEVELVKIEQIEEIVKRGVLSTPALAIDGTIKSTGRVPARADLVSWIRAACSAPSNS
ncbi:TM0996/MTH895 family glutaredoxin-like protein [candidate division KSB1 bacterium]|nr:TM0996/MTH895 family glutaredoxin-like protein [candidate division KSB1 bacterium]